MKSERALVIVECTTNGVAKELFRKLSKRMSSNGVRSISLDHVGRMRGVEVTRCTCQLQPCMRIRIMRGVGSGGWYHVNRFNLADFLETFPKEFDRRAA